MDSNDDDMEEMEIPNTKAEMMNAIFNAAKGKKKDELQESINAIKSIDIGLPIEFVNFRD